MLTLLLLMACGSCPTDLPKVDYTADASWVCKPGVDATCDAPTDVYDVLPDNSIAKSTSEVAEDPQIDCFYVYPTVDLGLSNGIHADLTDLTDQTATTFAQAARLHEVCKVWAPAYRQVKLGTYATVQEASAATADTTTATTAWSGNGAPSAAAAEPPSAPPASIRNTKSAVAASTAPSARDPPSQASHA
jgi:hypothetical protein